MEADLGDESGKSEKANSAGATSSLRKGSSSGVNERSLDGCTAYGWWENDDGAKEDLVDEEGWELGDTSFVREIFVRSLNPGDALGGGFVFKTASEKKKQGGKNITLDRKVKSGRAHSLLDLYETQTYGYQVVLRPSTALGLQKRGWRDLEKCGQRWMRVARWSGQLFDEKPRDEMGIKHGGREHCGRGRRRRQKRIVGAQNLDGGEGGEELCEKNGERRTLKELGWWEGQRGQQAGMRKRET